MPDKVRFRLLAVGAAAITMAGLGVAGPPAAAVPAATPAASDTGLWIVQLTEPSLAAHRAPADQLDVRSRASRTYLDRLRDQQIEVAQRLERRFDRAVGVERSYRHVLNAIVIEADPQEAAMIAGTPGVAAVHPERVVKLTTDTSHDVIGTAAFWDGDTGPDLATMGEGTVIGIVDSGINYSHPAFAATAPDGYTHTNPYPGYLGLCDPSHPFHQAVCNDKLVGAYSFVSAPAPDDNVGHGTHVAATAAGNRVQTTETYGADSFNLTVQGAAPRANLISYRVCNLTDCPQTAILDGIDQAVADQVDVLNLSISGEDDPWVNVVDQALLEAFGAGVFVAASAGNDGSSGPGSVAHTGPWNASVGATTTGRVFSNTVSVLSPSPVPPELVAASAWPARGTLHQADVTAEVIYSAEVGAEFEHACGSSFPAGSVTGAIVLIPIFGCSVGLKASNALDGGAIAVLLFDENLPGPPLFLPDAELASIPTARLNQEAGTALRDLVVSTAAPVTARLEADTALVVDPAAADDLASFSSLGPSGFDVLGPTFAAPGVNILAAFRPDDGGDPLQYHFAHGTSMASPHVAGAGALLKALHPTWSPAMILSALAGTADPAVTHHDGTAADPLATGAGRIDLGAAARVGLALDESYAGMVAADPGTGGDPRLLNLPYYVTHECAWFCSFSRVVTNVSDVTTDYQASITQPAGTSTSVSPTNFTLAPGASRTVTVQLSVFGVSSGEWVFADLGLTTTDSHAGGQPIADVRYPVAARFTG